MPTEFAHTNSVSHWIITTAIRFIVRILCDIQDRSIEKIPPEGPMIIVTNHINFLDAPIIYTHLMPRRLTALVKEETWDSRWLGFLFTLWGAIPIRRGGIDLAAMRSAKRSLNQGYFLAIAPEGTRSGDGILQKGYPGVAALAAYSQAPILPLALVGCENFWSNLKRLKRTKIHILVGDIFFLKSTAMQPDRETREELTLAIMLQIAALLPDSRRGVYQDIPLVPTDLLVFPNSNIGDAIGTR